MSLTSDYIFGPGATDDYLAYYNGGSYRWYSSDTIGTVKAVTNDGGMVVERYRYTPYGERTILSSTGTVRSATTVANFIGFTGRPHDVDTGLIDFRSRQFQPRLGRFISRDSKGYVDGHSLYRGYFAPNAADPTGHNVFGDIVSAVSGGASDAWNGLKSGATAVYHGAVDAAKALPGVAAGLAGDVGDVLDGAKLLGTELWNATTNLAEEAWDGISYLAGEVEDGAEYLYGKVKGGIRSWFRSAWDDLKVVGAFAWDFTKTLGQLGWDYLMIFWKLMTFHPEDAFKRMVNFSADIVNLETSALNLVMVCAAFAGNLTQPLPGGTTLLGIGLGLVGWAFTGFADRAKPSISWYDGGFVFEFPNNPMSFSAPGITYGRTILYAGTPTPARRAHELQHTVQYGALGDLYLYFQGVAGTISVIASGKFNNDGWHEYNWLEFGPEEANPEPFDPIPKIPRWN
jgi:RHS repeat-associated protein